MNVSSVSPATPAVSGADMISVSSLMSIKVLDLAQNVFKDVAEELISSMGSVIPGLGENIDVYA